MVGSASSRPVNSLWAQTDKPEQSNVTVMHCGGTGSNVFFTVVIVVDKSAEQGHERTEVVPRSMGKVALLGRLLVDGLGLDYNLEYLAIIKKT